jgi:hypothetical protein
MIRSLDPIKWNYLRRLWCTFLVSLFCGSAMSQVFDSASLTPSAPMDGDQVSLRIFLLDCVGNGAPGNFVLGKNNTGVEIRYTVQRNSFDCFNPFYPAPDRNKVTELIVPFGQLAAANYTFVAFADYGTGTLQLGVVGTVPGVIVDKYTFSVAARDQASGPQGIPVGGEIMLAVLALALLWIGGRQLR